MCQQALMVSSRAHVPLGLCLCHKVQSCAFGAWLHVVIHGVKRVRDMHCCDSYCHSHHHVWLWVDSFELWVLHSVLGVESKYSEFPQVHVGVCTLYHVIQLCVVCMYWLLFVSRNHQ